MHLLHSKTTRSIAIGVVILGSTTPGVLGWGDDGHEVVATIAQIYTHPTVLQKLCRILNDNDDDANFVDDTPSFLADKGADTAEKWPCHLASIATWADKFKDEMPGSGPLHYVNADGDNPPKDCVFPGPSGWLGKPGINVLGGIHSTSSTLISFVDGKHPDPKRVQEALKFLVHFLGDMHMPFHLTGKKKGGNKVDVCWQGRQTKLHIAWDDDVVEKAIRTVGPQYKEPLPAGFEYVEKNLRGVAHDPLIRKIIQEGLEKKWAVESKDWASCPITGGKDMGSEVKDELWGTLRDFFLPGWFSKRESVEVPVTDTRFICPYHWAKPIAALNCELIWPKALEGDIISPRVMAPPPPAPGKCKQFPPIEGEEGEFLYELDNPDYMGPVEERMLLEQFLGQGGVRLASALNYIFEGPRTA